MVSADPPYRLSVRNKLLDALWAANVRRSHPSATAEQLRRLLRRYPSWNNGHRLLAEASLSTDDIATAYASAVAYRQLTPSSDSQGEALLLLGKCFLRRGDWRSAMSFLQQALDISPHSLPIKEELAAAYMLGGDYSAAHAALEAIPEERRSPQAKTAIAFVRSKLS